MTKRTIPSFSSIFSANARVNPVWFAVAYLVALFLYWESFTGLPVWDDTTFWFFDPAMKLQSYGDIWKYSTWPLTVTLQKFLLVKLGYKYWVFHSLNFVLHGLNSWLVYCLLRTIGIRHLWSFAAFALFLVHPANVIAVAWMIQFKTLICFGFGIGSLIIFLRRKKPEDSLLAYALFLLSILSKSASLPLPFALLFLVERPLFRKRSLAVIPFFLIMAFGAYRINFSNLALEGVKNALETTGKGLPKKAPVNIQQEESKEPDSFSPMPDEPLVKSPEEFTPEDVSTTGTNKNLVELSPTAAKRRLFIKSLHYYFWQAYVPINNAPVKGQNPYPPTVLDYTHLVFLALLILISGKFYVFYLLAAGHIFLLPYLGLIPAPYMNITWVSDQHLYIALPFFIALFICLFDRVKFELKGLLIVILLGFYSVKTKEAAAFYKNNTVFYETSISRNFNNIPLVYNLAVIYSSEGQDKKAIELLESVFELSRNEPYLLDNKFFPFLLHMHGDIQKRMKK